MKISFNLTAFLQEGRTVCNIFHQFWDNSCCSYYNISKIEVRFLINSMSELLGDISLSIMHLNIFNHVNSGIYRIPFWRWDHHKSGCLLWFYVKSRPIKLTDLSSYFLFIIRCIMHMVAKYVGQKTDAWPIINFSVSYCCLLVFSSELLNCQIG